jgi:hypothetical protein
VQVSRTTIVVETDPLSEATVSVERAEIEDAFPAAISPMPTGLIDILEEQEILDLLALLKAGGDAKHSLFAK